MRIMVGYDGSNAAKDALVLAKKHAKAFEAKVFVISSLERGNEDQLPKIDQAERDLEYAKSFLEKDNIPCETHLLIRGLSPGEDLIQFANENEIDEIIVGVKRRSNVGKLVFGSNARYVIMEANCPVVTVK
ncbi:MAG: universal stress protein [Desulfobacterales bacterium]|nr:universal stress protein [Desulfobacterales bacterium]MDZ7597906.1 universal stress protein [Desulfobacterales bacterium]